MRAPEARRHGPGHRLQRRSRRAGAEPSRTRASSGCMSSISTAPSPARASTARRSSAILKATKNPVQLGGGIRTLAQIEDWLDSGLARVILGTVAVRDPDLVQARPAGVSRARSRSASTPRAARSRSRAGPRRRQLGVDRTGAEIRGRRRRRHHLHRHRPRRRAGRHQLGRDHRAGRRGVDPGHRLGRPRLDGRHRAHDHAGCAQLEGAISGRALYDGASTRPRRWPCCAADVHGVTAMTAQSDHGGRICAGRGSTAR